MKINDVVRWTYLIELKMVFFCQIFPTKNEIQMYFLLTFDTKKYNFMFKNTTFSSVKPNNDDKFFKNSTPISYKIHQKLSHLTAQVTEIYNFRKTTLRVNFNIRRPSQYMYLYYLLYNYEFSR